MLRRVALVQYDAEGAVLQASTCFVSAAPGTFDFYQELTAAVRRLKHSFATVVEAMIGPEAPVYRCDHDGCVDLQKVVN